MTSPLLSVNEKPVGVVEAKAAGHALSGVQIQARKYSDGLPDLLSPPLRPLPFVYSSTGVETLFVNLLDPEPRSRSLVAFHRPATLAEWLAQKPLADWVEGWRSRQEMEQRGLVLDRPATLRLRLRAMPDVVIPGLWANKVEAITRLEKSFYDDRLRALIQMATGAVQRLTSNTIADSAKVVITTMQTGQR